MIEAERENRFVGSILGVAFGDALGAPVEGWDMEQIRSSYGQVRDFLPGPRGDGRYTDDTQMTLALAVSIDRCGGVNGADCARSYADFFQPERGYGGGAAAVLAKLKAGEDYRKTGTMFFPEGSFGNGAAMRIAPVGLLFGGEPEDSLRHLVFEAVRCTHVHPEAIDGAVVQAAAVHRMASAEREEAYLGVPLLRKLAGYCRTKRMRDKLEEAERLLTVAAPDDTAAARLGTGIRASDSVPVALFSALRRLDDPEEAIVRAVALGGDTDTIGAMTGAMVGAFHGARRFPRRWYEGLENGAAGLDDMEEVARRLAGLEVGKL